MSCFRNSFRKRCISAMIITGIFCLLFQAMLIAMINLQLNIAEDIKGIIFSETPIYDLRFSTEKPFEDQAYIECFHEFKGREKIVSSDNKKQTSSSSSTTKTEIYSQGNITKIYQNYFIYNNDKRTYLDYNRDYTVAEGENCPENYKKCGIFNSLGRILCLPNEETCPLNDFAISSVQDSLNYKGYNKKEVIDSVSNNKYYFYYTNKKIDNKIITNFKLSYGYPCADSSEISWVTVFDDEVDDNPTCKKIIQDKKTDDRYVRVDENGITLKSLYEDNDINTFEADISMLESTVGLYARNFFNKNEECMNKYFSDIENENNEYHKAKIIIRVLCIISAILMLALVIYIGLTCYYDLQIYLLFIIVHIYGIVAYIVSIVLSSRKKFEYVCDEDKKLNRMINEIFEDSYKNNQNLVIGLCVPSIFTLILNLIATLCLKYNTKNGTQMQNYMYNPGLPISMMGTPQQIYVQQQQNPINNKGYPIPFTPNNNQNISNDVNPTPTTNHKKKIKSKKKPPSSVRQLNE